MPEGGRLSDAFTIPDQQKTHITHEGDVLFSAIPQWCDPRIPENRFQQFSLVKTCGAHAAAQLWKVEVEKPLHWSAFVLMASCSRSRNAVP
ncbi:hypothetical protein [Synechococcus sp. UW179A]|uniref:hypothetical protein n=1 Tax=Synechococcus sp. UW179A TaxID=2575510 RepID=UPI0010BF050C|nr:hypothetical protein [Synechococcus sp. UW179A]